MLVPIPAEAAILDDVVTDLVVRAPASDAENMERIVELFHHMYDILDRHVASVARDLAVEDRLEALVPVLAEEVVIRGPALVPMPAAELADRAYALADRIDALEVSVHSVGPRLDALEALVPTPADGVIDAVVRVPATDFDHRSRMMDRRIMNRRLFDLQALEDRGWQMVEEMRLERLADMRWQRLTDRQALEDRLLQMVLDRINGARSNQ